MNRRQVLFAFGGGAVLAAVPVIGGADNFYLLLRSCYAAQIYQVEKLWCRVTALFDEKNEIWRRDGGIWVSKETFLASGFHPSVARFGA